MDRKSVIKAYESANIGCSIGGVTIDSNYYIVIADISFHSFLWENTYFPITEIISPDNIDEFKEMIADVTEDKPQEMFLLIKGNDGVYIPAFVTAKMSSYRSQSGVNYDLEFSNAINAAKNIKQYKFLIRKLKEFVGLSGCVLFEYEIKSNSFKIYYEVKGSCNVIYDGAFSDFKENVLKNGLVEENSVSTFKDFCNDIERCKNNFIYTLKCSFIPGISPETPVKIKAITINEDLNAIVTVGIISTENTNVIKTNFFNDKANIDALTGILNKRAITEYAKNQVENVGNRNVVIVIMDIDYFKKINDTYGHMAGDTILSTISTVIQNSVEGKGIPGRIGGDEFFIVFDNIESENQLRLIIREIHFRMGITCKEKIPDLDVTCTMGIAQCPKDAQDFETLFKIADKALYIGKLKGRNRFIIYRCELHGALEETDEERMNIQLEKTPLCKRKAVMEVIESFENKKAENIKGLAENIKENYNLDDVRLYYGDDLKLFSSATGLEFAYDKEIKTLLDCENENYYTEENTLVIDNYVIFEYRNKKIYKFLEENKIFSIIVYVVKDKGKVVGIITFSMIDTLRKWSEWDINMLTIIAKLLGKKLIEQ